MKNQIKNIFFIKNQIINYDNLILDKENDILACIKAVNQDDIKLRQKKAASSLLDLKSKKADKEKELKTLLKGLDNISFKNKKMSSDLIVECIWNGICGKPFKQLKSLYSSL